MDSTVYSYDDGITFVMPFFYTTKEKNLFKISRMLIFVTSEPVLAVLLFLLFSVAFPLSGLPPDGKRFDEKLSETVSSDCFSPFMLKT